MANETFTVNQITNPFIDSDADGVVDPGETVQTTVTITNNSTAPTPTDATGVTFTETLQGMTLVDQPGALDDVNVSPLAFDDGGYTAAGNVQFTAAVSVLANDTEPLGPEGLALNAGTALQNTGVAFASAQGGSVTLNADGTFTYVSAVGFEGTDTFTYTLRDTGLDGVAGNADDLTGTGTVSITVGPSVWFIDNTAPAGGDGTQASPFNSIAAFNLAQGMPNGPDDGDVIYLRQGTGTYSEADGFNLANNQTLIGAGQDLVVNGVTIETATSAPTIEVTGAGGEGVLLAQNNTLSGFDISSTNAAADGIEDGGGTVGNLTISDVAISGTGQAVDIDQGGTLNVTLDSVTSTGASEEGIQLAGVAGSFTATTVSLNGMAGDAVDLDGNSATVAINGGSIGNINDPGGIGVDVNGGTGNVTIGASINKTTAGDVVEVTGRTGGTVDFNANITSTNGGGIDLTGSSGGTIRFDGGMNLSTGATTAFNATGNTGTTLVVTDPGAGSNILTTTTGIALNVANTTIGAEDLTFQSISANGASSGIILNNTGTGAGDGGLIVTGDTGTSANGSGGVIQNSTGAGISLTNTRDVSLDQLNVTSGDADGIHGVGVVNFTLNRSNVTNNGDSTADDGLQFGEVSGSVVGVTGNVSILASSISGNAHNGVHIRNTSGTIDNLTVTGSTFNDVNDTFGANAFLFEASGTSTVTEAFITGSTFSNNTPQRALEVQSHDTATISDFVVSGNIFTNNGIHASFTQDGSSNHEFYFVDNGTVGTPMTGSVLQAINVFSSSQSTGGTIVGTIQGNQVGSTQAGAISAVIQGQTDATLLIDSNVISQTNGDSRAISVSFRGPSNPLAGTLGPNTVVSDVTITNNNVTPGAAPSGFPLATIVVEADNQSGADNKAPTVRADIRGNTVPTTPVFDFLDAHIIYYEYDAAGGHGIGQLVNTTGAATADQQLDNTNTGTVGSNGISLIAGPINLPAAVPTPLLAASDGVERDVSGTTIDSSDTGLQATPPAEAAPEASGGSQPPAAQPDPQAPVDTAASDTGPPPAHPVIVDEGVLSQAALDFFVDAAIARWASAGLTPEQIEALEAMSFGVTDMSGPYLGAFTPTQITIDADAAGRGWFLDATPLDDVEFGNGSGTWLTTDPTGAPAGHYDLLTTVMHEMGHALGLEDRYEGTARDALMYGWLFVGERRLPGAGDADGAVAGAITSEEFLGAPIDIGTLPAGKTVTIQWQATIDPQTNQLIVDPQNTGTVTATNGFPSANTNTVTTLDTLILGGTVWNDNGAGGGTAANGILDGTEPGVAGVTLSLFVDADNDNVIDNEAGAPVATATTAGGGLYTFTGLAPGNYIVRVDLANFQGGGALNGIQISSPGNPDPDNDIDNDDNGSRTFGQAAYSQTITLAYNTEPITDGDADADTNLSLDLGFRNNPPPVINNLGGDTASFIEGAAAVLLDDAGAPATVTDDQAHFNGGSLTVSITANEAALEDVLGISTAGTVTLSNGTNVGSVVSVGGLAIGTVTSDGTGGNDLVVTFDTTDATPANVGLLINALTYFNSNTLNPSTLQRTIAVTVNDGLAGTDTETAFVNVMDIDDEAPMVTIDQAAGQGDPTNGSPILFDVVFNEPVVDFTAADISLAGSTVGGTLVASVSGSGANYTVSVTGMSGSGTVVASIGADAVLDLAGNSNVASTSTDNTVTFDGVAPLVTIDQAAGQGDPTNGSPILFDVVFSEPVVDFTAADISLAGSTVGGTLVASVSGSGANYTVSVTGMTGDGTVVASIGADAALDSTGNPSAASTSTDNTVTFDTVAPLVTIDQAAGQGDPTNGSPILFDVVFSEPVVDFTAADISLAGSTVGGTLAASVSGSGASYTVSVTGMSGSGAVVASIVGGAAQDLTGNPSAASTSTDNTVTVLDAPPTVTINQGAGQGDPTGGSPILFDVQFSEPVTGFAADDISFAGSTVGGALAASVSGSGANYTVSATGMSGAGTVVASIGAGAALDQSFNPSEASTSTDNTVTVGTPVAVVGSVSISAAGDFNSNGRQDYIWRDASAVMTTWEYDATAQTLTQADLGAVGFTWNILASDHFSNATMTDQMLTRNLANDAMTLWWVENGQLTGAHIGQNPFIGQVWNGIDYLASGQFTDNGGAGIANFLVTNVGDDHLYDWWIDANNQLQGIDLGAAWSDKSLIGTGEFTTHGGTDFLVANDADHHLYDWWIDANNQLQGVDLGAAWSDKSFIGAGEFTPNGLTDFLVANNADHHLYDWWIDPTSHTLQGIDLGARWSNIEHLASGHFSDHTTGDQILVRNTVDNHLYEWWIDPTSHTLQGVDLGPAWSSSYQLIDSGDFNNASPNDELLVRNSADGHFYEWWIANNQLQGADLGNALDIL